MILIDLDSDHDYFLDGRYAIKSGADVVEVKKPDHGYMWICPQCGLDVHSDYGGCIRCGYMRDNVVEVIRCKDCKWKQGAECVRFADVRPFSDDFCSRAERRET